MAGLDPDALGRFVAAFGLLAMVAYLLPGAMALSPAWAKRLELAMYGLLGIAGVFALLATVAWFAGR